jgi:PilZ domain
LLNASAVEKTFARAEVRLATAVVLTQTYRSNGVCSEAYSQFPDSGHLVTVTSVHCETAGIRASLFVCAPLAPACLPQSTNFMDARTSTGTRNGVARRRSPRIALSTPIKVSGEDRQNCAFTLGAVATNLNRHGAAIQVERELAVGATVQVRNGRGVEASARVVAQVKAVQGKCTYGIEFLEEGDRLMNFWGITFPQAPSA